MSETELKAPFAGIVAEIAPVAGEQVGAGAAVVRLADLSAWQIETDDLTELDVVKVKVGTPASIDVRRAARRAVGRQGRADQADRR